MFKPRFLLPHTTLLYFPTQTKPMYLLPQSLRHDNMIVYPEEQKWGISSQNGKHVWRKDGEPKVAKKVKLIVRLLSPYTRTEIPRGIIEFKGHQEPSIEMSRPSWEELRQETARLPRVKQVAHIIPAAGDGAATAAVTSKDKGANSATPSVGSVTSKVAVRKHSSSGAEGTHTEEIAHFSPRRTRSQSAAMKASEAVAQLPPMKRRKTSSRAVAREQEKDDGPEVMDDNSTKISEVDSFSPRRTRSVTLAKAAASTSDNNVSDEEDFFVSPVKYAFYIFSCDMIFLSPCLYLVPSKTTFLPYLSPQGMWGVRCDLRGWRQCDRSRAYLGVADSNILLVTHAMPSKDQHCCLILISQLALFM